MLTVYKDNHYLKNGHPEGIGLTIPTAERYIRAWTGTRLEKVVRGRYRKATLCAVLK